MIRVIWPRTPHEIQDRVTELSFNTTFWMEVGGLAVILKLMDAGLLDRERFGRILFISLRPVRNWKRSPPRPSAIAPRPSLAICSVLGGRPLEEIMARHGEAIGDHHNVRCQKADAG